MIRRLGPGLLLVCLAAAHAAGSTPLIRDGVATVAIVVPDDAIAPEWMAARLLSEYLYRATSARFPILREAAAVDGPAIRVGPSDAARRLGVDAGRMDHEQWRIVTAEGSLVLAGGRPRGTIYAVYHFLEDQIGVRWWTAAAESVPRREELTLAEIDISGRPAFVYRDLHGVQVGREFLGHNRANGHFAFLPWALGGSESYGPPSPVHNFYDYVPPAEHFELHPEFYSEVDGRRLPERGQLCLTNDVLLDLVADELRGFIDQARAEAGPEAVRAPKLFEFSQMDWKRACDCEPCSRIDAEQGSRSGSLVQFLNRLAETIEGDYPEVLLGTLAYGYTFEPPQTLTLRNNVAVRLSALQRRDFLKPVSDRVHRDYQEAIAGWAARSQHLRIWDYSVTFGFEANNFPLPNLPVVAADLRYYRDRGVEGIFIQHDHPIAGDMRDLKVWVILKLMEDPDLDLERLVVEFTDGYYGPAAATVREYLDLLSEAARKSRASIRYPVEPSQYRYLTPRFLRSGQQLFDRAEREVADDAELSRRVRHARLSLDRATLWFWKPKLGRKGRRGNKTALDPGTIERRVRATAFEEIDQRIPERYRERKRQWVERDLWLAREPTRGAD